MKNYYDIAIIGGGIGGLMAAYRITERDPSASVCIIEKGHTIEKRSCPIVTKKVDKCIKCPSCAIMEGLAGFLKPQTVIDYIEQADKILVSFGATTERFLPDNELKKLCLSHDLHMNQAQLKHLGTDSNFETMRRLIEQLRTRCDIITDTEVTDVDRETMQIQMHSAQGDSSCKAGKIIFAVGRVGSRFFSAWCTRNQIELSNNQVDVGVRVELPAIVWEDFSKRIYEPKIWYRSKQYGDKTRMFCFNERGSVVTENTDGVLTVNGHSYRDQSRKTENSNFALLSTIRFTEPFKQPIDYARHVASLANLISGGSVLVQRLGDLESGRRTDAKRLAASTTQPTLNAVPGDLSLCMPKRQLDNIIETLHALDAVAPGTANYDTLLYGIECKYYSARPQTENFKLCGCENIYAVGDGAGFRFLRQLPTAYMLPIYCVNKNKLSCHFCKLLPKQGLVFYLTNWIYFLPFKNQLLHNLTFLAK